ncbi:MULTISPECIES: DUF805 domain-containing protein [Providencia]|uniref:DUF805 domain-containing protein n=2 Tax=Morganellaceae TaxID=1903414 RepID=UPI000839908A|nr:MULTISPECIES: DUF805 domain-containing protein [Providencia]MBP6122223.1 DUF805 domain-containing protein [Providencia sp.]NIH22483.1 DUF805 domain-containing protein [Providencia heimbachae]QCJ69860.1 DUF805 domain-containing protein [Providencia heimbachae]
MNWYLEVLKNNYANFSGRARRKEYWMFTLVNMVIIMALYAIIFSSIDYTTGEIGGFGTILSIIVVIYVLGVFIPSLAVTIRRLHDTDKSGWWYLISFIPFGAFVLLVFLCLDGSHGDNKFGADPKA